MLCSNVLKLAFSLDNRYFTLPFLTIPIACLTIDCGTNKQKTGLLKLLVFVESNQTKTMKHVAAYLMLVLGGNSSPTADDVSSALSSVGIESDTDSLSKLIAELEGKDLNEVLAAGKDMLAQFGGGGGSGGAGGAAGGDEAGAEKEEEAPEEEEMDLGGGMDMFGGGDAGDDY